MEHGQLVGKRRWGDTITMHTDIGFETGSEYSWLRIMSIGDLGY
jgi:hypothetical protein